MKPDIDLEHFAHGEISPRCPHPFAHPHPHEEAPMSSSRPMFLRPVPGEEIPVATSLPATVVALERELAVAEERTATTRAHLRDALRIVEELQADADRAAQHEEAVRALLIAERTHRGLSSRFARWARQVAAGVDPVVAARTLQGEAS